MNLVTLHLKNLSNPDSYRDEVFKSVFITNKNS